MSQGAILACLLLDDGRQFFFGLKRLVEGHERNLTADAVVDIGRDLLLRVVQLEVKCVDHFGIHLCIRMEGVMQLIISWGYRRYFRNRFFEVEIPVFVTWYIMAVCTATVTLSFVLVFVFTLSCVVRMETDATDAMGQSTTEQPGWIIDLNFPHSCPASIVRSHHRNESSHPK